MDDKGNKLAVLVCILGLLAMYLLQRTDYFGLLMKIVNASDPNPNMDFAFNRAFRLVVNDLLCMGIIYFQFREKQFLKIGFWVFMLELLLILPIYLFIKLKWEGPTEISSPLLSPIHRMVVNPLLMIVLFAGLLFQKKWGAQ